MQDDVFNDFIPPRVRDVGVAGSNPVIPTNESIEVFTSSVLMFQELRGYGFLNGFHILVLVGNAVRQHCCDRLIGRDTHRIALAKRIGITNGTRLALLTLPPTLRLRGCAGIEGPLASSIIAPAVEASI
jgi:hypothetical protein